MERDGMVAIVQGLADAGLAVTLVNRTHLQNVLPPYEAPKSSVETSTDAGKAAAKTYDGHSTNRYQVQCSIRSCSPPERLTEFPPQRAEPCRTQGNFQIGGYSAEDNKYMSPANSNGGSQTYRAGMVWPDRGSALFGRVSPPIPSQTDPFVHSLRRYPLRHPCRQLPSLQRSLSAELVQRLFSYTHNKYLGKNTSFKSSMEGPSHDTSTKNIQTYTRAKQSRDNGANTSNEIRFNLEKPRKYYGTSDHARGKPDQYEYLKGARRCGRHPEVRYLSDMKRCIKDTIKQMYEDKPVTVFQVCPQIRSRYSKHKKEHHRPSTEESTHEACLSHPKLCCHCKKPLPCLCEPGTSSLKSLLPSDDIPDIVPYPESVDDGRCTCKPNGRSENKIEKEILKWIRDIPVYADDSIENKNKREEMVKDLAGKLKELDQDNDFENRAKEHIMNFIENLPMWYPGGKVDREMFKKQIADDLYNRIISIDDKDSGIKDTIAKWFDDVAFENEIPDKEEIVKSFVNRLKPLLNKPDDMKDEIINALQELPILNNNKEINKLADELSKKLTNIMTNKINNPPSSPVTLTPEEISSNSPDIELEKKIISWLEDIPDLPIDIKEDNVMVKNLVETLRKTHDLDMNEEEKQAKMNEEVIDWIDTVLKNNGNEMNIQRKKALSKRLLDKLLLSGNDIPEVEKSGKNTFFDDGMDIEEKIWHWLEEIADIPIKNRKKVQEEVQKLAKKLQDYNSENNEGESVLKEIMNFLEILPEMGVSVTSTEKDTLIKDLLDKTKLNPNQNKSSKDGDHLQQSILSEISELIEDIPSNIDKSTRKEITNKIADILTRNFDNLFDKNDNISNEIIKILQKYAKIPENEAAALTSALIFRIKGMPQLPKADNDIKQYVLEEVNDVFHDYDINQRVRSEMVDTLTDQIVRGTNNDETKDKIGSILHKANVSDDDDEISNRLLDINKKLSLSYKTQDSKIGISKDRIKNQTMSPMEKDNFEENAQREVLDLIEDFTGKNSPRTKKKRQVAAEELIHKLGNIMSGADDTDKGKSIIEEVAQFLRKLSLDLDISKEEAQKLANRLQNVNFQASTPKNERPAFYPKRDVPDISSIHTDDDNNSGFQESLQFKSKEENGYANKLKNIIQSWMNEQLKNFNKTEDKSLNETIVQDLADDIIDRQKYLQLNPDTKTSDQEELEHLKYQVFRWLNKLLDIDDLSPVIQKTETLMTQIKEIDVPKLVKKMEKQSNKVEKLIQDAEESLKDEISQWMEEIPSNLIAPVDKNFQTRMISELADKIQKLRANNQAGQMDSEIRNWLSRLIKEVDKKELTNLTEALKERLKEGGFIEESFTLNQDSSQFVEENLAGAINDWLKNLPWYQTRNAIDKLKGQSAVLELVKGLKSVIEAAKHSDTAAAEKKILDEIIQQLYKFPMDIEQKSDKNFIRNTAEQLLDYLQGLQIFQNISERSEISPDEYLIKNLNNWFSTLPISKMNSNEALNFENLKAEFTDKIKQIRKEDLQNERKLKEEIRSFLKRFPIEDNAKNKQEFLDDNANKLFKNLLWVPIETEERYASDTVKNAVNSWIKSLPLERGKTVNDIPNNVIDKLTSAVEELLLNTNLTSSDLEDETDKFLRKVPLDPNIPSDTKSLSEALLMLIKNKSKRLSSPPIPSTDNSPPIKKAADLLFDEIERWCDSLNIKEDTPEETERVKKDIARKVLRKVGELNMNPEIFNDDFLYVDMLEDEIDNLLSNLHSEYIKNNQPTIKNDLIEKIKEARHKTQEETAGQAYKQQMREAISRTMPTESLTLEERASFEILKDNLADAFLNLHYTGGDEKLKNTYKTKIHDKVSKFCNDYLKKHPASPIDSKKLNQDLYKSLKNVPIPKEETVRNEVELVKVKDVVNEWLKELPLKEQDPAEKIHTNKIISLTSKKIHDIEKEKELHPDDNTDVKMRKEITKLVKKLPLTVDDDEIIKLINKLIDNLKNTEKSRKISASKRHSIESDMFSFPPSSEQKIHQPSSSGSCILPPSSLTNEDREHLQRIKERSATSSIQCPFSKNAAVSTVPANVGSQTEVRPSSPPTTGRCYPWETSPTYGKRLSRQNSSVQTQNPPLQKTMQAVGSQAEVSPRVIVKEYYWGNTCEIPEMCIPSPCKQPTTPYESLRSEQPVSLQPSKHTTPCSQCPHIPVTTSPQGGYCSQTPPRKEWEKPCHSREMPGVFSEDHTEPGSCFRSKEKVTKLGSFDNMEPNNTKSKEWCFDEDDFWGDKRKFLCDEDDENVFKERKKEEEKFSCRCRERILTKCHGGKRGRGIHTSCQPNDVKRCSKCCGIHCPYPSYLYFRE